MGLKFKGKGSSFVDFISGLSIEGTVPLSVERIGGTGCVILGLVVRSTYSLFCKGFKSGGRWVCVVRYALRTGICGKGLARVLLGFIVTNLTKLVGLSLLFKL